MDGYLYVQAVQQHLHGTSNTEYTRYNGKACPFTDPLVGSVAGVAGVAGEKEFGEPWIRPPLWAKTGLRSPCNRRYAQSE
jgi:hypothetical protein